MIPAAEIGSVVRVRDSHRRHGGRVGVVLRHGSCSVQIEDEAGHKFCVDNRDAFVVESPRRDVEYNAEPLTHSLRQHNAVSNRPGAQGQLCGKPAPVRP